MHNLSVLGVVPVILGAGALLLGRLNDFDTTSVPNAGSIHTAAQEVHRISIPPAAGLALLLCGIGMIVIGRRLA